MTRRPPMPPDGNVRRAHQRMAPGGRLWSESPVRGPAVRVAAAGDDTAACVTLRPDTIADYDDQPVDYQGGGGQSTLSDQSDSTFLRLFYDLSPTDFYGTPVATFEAGTLPGEPSAASLTIRARSLDNTGSNKISFNLAADILGTYSPYYTDSDEVDAGGGWTPGGSWVDYTYSWVSDPSNPLYSLILPSASEVAAGGIQILITPAITTGADMQLDIADVWLELCP